MISFVLFLFVTIHIASGQDPCAQLKTPDACQAVEFCQSISSCECTDYCQGQTQDQCSKIKCCDWSTKQYCQNNQMYPPQCNVEDKSPCANEYQCSFVPKYSFSCYQPQVQIDSCGVFYSQDLCQDSYYYYNNNCMWISGEKQPTQLKCIDQCQQFKKVEDCKEESNGCQFVCQWDYSSQLCRRNIQFPIPTHDPAQAYPCRFDRCAIQFSSQCQDYSKFTKYNNICGFYYTQEMCLQIGQNLRCQWVNDQIQPNLCVNACQFGSNEYKQINGCMKICDKQYGSRNHIKDSFITSNGLKCDDQNCEVKFSPQCIPKSKIQSQY